MATLLNLDLGDTFLCTRINELKGGMYDDGYRKRVCVRERAMMAPVQWMSSQIRHLLLSLI